MQITVVGGGSMGSLFAASLTAAGHAVTLLDTSPERARAARDGLHVEGATDLTVAVDATTDPGALSPASLVLVAVKAHDTDRAMADAAGAIGEDTAVLTLQNGLGNAETIADHVPGHHVLAGTTAHGATLLEPGRLRHAGTGPTRIGRFDGPNDAGVTAAADALADAGFETAVVADVRDALWRKVAINAGINAATALTGVENGAMVRTDPGERLLSAAVEEAARVARAEGRSVPASAVDEARAVARETAANVSSMRQDLEAGRRTEVDAINGAVVERGARHGVETPVNRTLADLVSLAGG